MSQIARRRALLVLALGSAAVAACVQSTNDGTPGLPSLDGGAFESGGGGGSDGGEDAGGSGHDASVDTGLAPSDAGAPDATSDAAADAGPATPVDPFVARWRAPADIPAGSSYTLDADAGVVTDKTTGLIWSRRLLSAAELPPDAGDGSPTTQAEARAQCAAATIGGTNGWRLPTRIEWLSLVRLDEEFVNDTTAFVASDWFGGIPFWTMTDDPTRSAIYDDHYHNHTFKMTLASFAAASIRCVKPPYAVTTNAQAAPAGRFVVDATTVTDTVTHLVWARAYQSTSIVDSAAATYCSGLASSDAGVDAGAKPWRLPTVKELASLWNEATGLPPELDTVANSQSYWTSTPYVKPSSVVSGYAHFRFTFYKPAATGNAGGDFSWDAQAVLAPARCVRALD